MICVLRIPPNVAGDKINAPTLQELHPKTAANEHGHDRASRLQRVSREVNILFAPSSAWQESQ